MMLGAFRSMARALLADSLLAHLGVGLAKALAKDVMYMIRVFHSIPGFFASVIGLGNVISVVCWDRCKSLAGLQVYHQRSDFEPIDLVLFQVRRIYLSLFDCTWSCGFAVLTCIGPSLPVHSWSPRLAVALGTEPRHEEGEVRPRAALLC